MPKRHWTDAFAGSLIIWAPNFTNTAPAIAAEAAKKAKKEEEEAVAAAGPNKKQREDAAWKAAVADLLEALPHLFEENFTSTLTEEEKTARRKEREEKLRILVGPEAEKDAALVAAWQSRI